MLASVLQLIPNSKKLLAILCVMLAAESIAYYEVHQRHENLIKERDRLIQETIELIKAKQHKKPDNGKDITL